MKESILDLLFSPKQSSKKLNVGVLDVNTLDGVDQDNLAETMGEYIKKHDLNVLVGPEYLFESSTPYSQEEKNQIIDQLIQYSKGRNVLIVPGTIVWGDNQRIYNTTPVIANGELLGEYHKRTGPKDTRKGIPIEFGKSHALHLWNGLKVGVEICSDAEDEGMLKSYLDKNKIPYPDLYILPACGYVLKGFTSPDKIILDVITNPPIKEGGHGINSDGYYGISTVVQKKADKYHGSQGIRDKNISVYQITP